LKWAGGKRQLLNEITMLLPSTFDNYHEPMLGGGALLLELEPEGGSVNDINSRLMNFYNQVRDSPEELIDRCRKFRDPESEADPERDFNKKDRKGKEVKNYYYQQRAIFNRRPNREEFDELEEAALLLYLNRTCFNGLYRENSDGEFNVPIGDYSNPDWVRDEEVRKASKVLQGIDSRNKDFQYILKEIEQDDMVYFDPPYKPMSETADFTQYSSEGFGREEQNRLLAVLRKLDGMGVYFIASNSGVVAEKYGKSRFDVIEVNAKRTINSDGSSREEVDEILVTNVPPRKRRGSPKKN